MVPVLQIGSCSEKLQILPRCFHFGIYHKKTTTLCPSKPKDPVCLNCSQAHSTSYKLSPSRMEQVKAAQIRLGVTPRPKTMLPATIPPTSNPWVQKTTLVAKTLSPDFSLATDFPDLPTLKPAKTNYTPVSYPNIERM
ncbi:hypothetical protein LSH36_135g05056 [Paralvinella palmiformis]|uniref:Uncharacterized protein n=1 Tax=Paralvinella palmiformis TaxID=53620 RepID=A0AAD9JWM1_9ANNE|nr:hypothetical protein LSH36_135g05056 [Paralvinella palmiformis]